MPPNLEKLLERCLQKDPRRRFQHIGDVQILLEDVKEDLKLKEHLKEELKEDRPRSKADDALRKNAHRGIRIHRVAFGLAIVIAAGAAAAFALRVGPFQSGLTKIPSKAVPFTSFEGRELEPAVSADGKQVAFVWDGERGENFDIYVKLIGADAPLD